MKYVALSHCWGLDKDLDIGGTHARNYDPWDRLVTAAENLSRCDDCYTAAGLSSPVDRFSLHHTRFPRRLDQGIGDHAERLR